jgi:hypothetical protein
MAPTSGRRRVKQDRAESHGTINALDRSHAASTASDPVEAISRIGALGGLHRLFQDTCLADQDHIEQCDLAHDEDESRPGSSVLTQAELAARLGCGDGARPERGTGR